MRINLWRRCLDADRMGTSVPRTRRAAIAKVESLEGRDLLSTMVFHSPAGSPPVQVAAQASSTPPTVAFAQFEPLTGRVLVDFSADSAGYNAAVLTNPANYSFSVVQTAGKLPKTGQSRPKAGVVLAPTFQVTGVSLSTPDDPGMPQSVIVSINNNQPLRPGTYRFAVKSAGIVDLAGRPLDGTYTGTFPSGGGSSGDFVAILAQTHNTVLPALPTSSTAGSTSPTGVVPTYVFLPSTQGVRVRYAAAKPGKFQLAGGNKITLIPLQRQHFPGTFRLAKLDPSLIPVASSARKHR
jgi:hypothetical protein